MLPPLGILFALLVGFIAVEVGNNFDKSKGSGCVRGQRIACCRPPRRKFPRRTEDAHLRAGRPPQDEAINKEWRRWRDIERAS